MNIFKRLFRVGKAEAHSAIDKLEDPIKMTEQGIRELKVDLDKSLHGLAEVKAMAIRSKNDYEKNSERANEFEKKAMLLLQKAEKGQLDAAEADRLATEALSKKKEFAEAAAAAKRDQVKFEDSAEKLNKNIKMLKSKISTYENELRTLKARVRVSKATKNINKQMANIDSSGTVNMLERMKEKVAQEEALAESYGEIADEGKSVEDEIDKALDGTEKFEAQDDLAALKKKMGIGGEDNKTE